MTELKLENLPMHELKKRAKKAGLKIPSNMKKDQIIDCILKGKTPDTKRIAPQKPHLEESKGPKIISLLPDNFEQNMKVKFPRLDYEIDEESNCINFKASNPMDRSVIPLCVNIDSNERIIYKTAEDCLKAAGNGLSIDDRNNIQAARLDQEERERKRLKEQAQAEMLAQFESNKYAS